MTLPIPPVDGPPEDESPDNTLDEAPYPHESSPNVGIPTEEKRFVVQFYRFGFELPETHEMFFDSAAQADSAVSSARDGGGLWHGPQNERTFWPWHTIDEVQVIDRAVH